MEPADRLVYGVLEPHLLVIVLELADVLLHVSRLLADYAQLLVKSLQLAGNDVKLEDIQLFVLHCHHALTLESQLSLLLLLVQHCLHRRELLLHLQLQLLHALERSSVGLGPAQRLGIPELLVLLQEVLELGDLRLCVGELGFARRELLLSLVQLCSPQTQVHQLRLTRAMFFQEVLHRARAVHQVLQADLLEGLPDLAVVLQEALEAVRILEELAHAEFFEGLLQPVVARQDLRQDRWVFEDVPKAVALAHLLQLLERLQQALELVGIVEQVLEPEALESLLKLRHALEEVPQLVGLAHEVPEADLVEDLLHGQEVPQGLGVLQQVAQAGLLEDLSHAEELLQQGRVFEEVAQARLVEQPLQVQELLKGLRIIQQMAQACILEQPAQARHLLLQVLQLGLQLLSAGPRLCQVVCEAIKLLLVLVRRDLQLPLQHRVPVHQVTQPRGACLLFFLVHPVRGPQLIQRWH
mmetsp:Transcript_58094/g.149570  ORF Transcript_58094/g.149570 Transcript_58094/m.149570 type:complete len:468 (-) Transcript_58094:1694-3097(-)